jgi:hypothetical protein
MAIVESMWDYDFDPGTNLVDVYVMRLREIIDGGLRSADPPPGILIGRAWSPASADGGCRRAC